MPNTYTDLENQLSVVLAGLYHAKKLAEGLAHHEDKVRIQSQIERLHEDVGRLQTYVATRKTNPASGYGNQRTSL